MDVVVRATAVYLSLTAAFLVIATLVSMEVLMSYVGDRWRLVDHLLDSRPEVKAANGHLASWAGTVRPPSLTCADATKPVLTCTFESSSLVTVLRPFAMRCAPDVHQEPC